MPQNRNRNLVLIPSSSIYPSFWSIAIAYSGFWWRSNCLFCLLVKFVYRWLHLTETVEFLTKHAQTSICSFQQNILMLWMMFIPGKVRYLVCQTFWQFKYSCGLQKGTLIENTFFLKPRTILGLLEFSKTNVIKALQSALLSPLLVSPDHKSYLSIYLPIYNTCLPNNLPYSQSDFVILDLYN